MAKTFSPVSASKSERFGSNAKLCDSFYIDYFASYIVHMLRITRVFSMEEKGPFFGSHASRVPLP
jgi:hypothetical protein